MPRNDLHTICLYKNTVFDDNRAMPHNTAVKPSESTRRAAAADYPFTFTVGANPIPMARTFALERGSEFSGLTESLPIGDKVVIRFPFPVIRVPDDFADLCDTAGVPPDLAAEKVLEDYVANIARDLSIFSR